MQIYKSNAGHEFIILTQEGKACTIQFLKSGFVRKANIDNIRAGKVRDLYEVSVYGQGYYGEFEKVSYWKQAKQLWQNMLKRCYCEADAKGYFGKVEVDARWKCFANFLEDLPKLENFDKWLDQKDGKYNLDKDLKVPGCRVYSREVCAFVPESVNKSDGGSRGGKVSKPYTRKPRVGKALTSLV